MIPLTETAAKVVLLLVLAALVAGLLRRRSAALRHLVWMVALSGALALPAVSPVIPVWSVAVPVVGNGEWGGGDRAGDREPESATTPASPVATPRVMQEAVPPHGAGRPEEAGAGASSAPPASYASHLVPSLWAFGALAVLLYFAIGWLRVARLVRTSRPGDADWIRMLEEAGRRIGLKRPARVVLTPAVSVPVVWGWWRPVLVLPLESEEWSEGARRSCLLHELAHVRRADGLAQLVVTLAAAAWWFLPPVWFAIRRAADERERACDDVVLRSGARPSEYAGDLLRLVRQAGGWPLPAGSLALGRPSRLGRRVRAILDPARSRSAPGAGSSVTVLASAVTLVVGVAALQPVATPRQAAAGTGVLNLPPADTTALRVAPLEEARGISVSDQLCRGAGSNSTSFNQDNDGHRRWTVHYQGDDCSVDLRAEGKIEFNDDFTDIASISSGGYFRVKVEDHGERRELEIRPQGNGLSRTWKVNGTERPWDREAQQWFARFLVDLDRRTAVGVDIRFPRLYRQGGAAAVLAETAQMPGDFARGQYYNKLLKHQLKPAELERLLDQVREMHTGDFFAAQALQGVARQNLSDAGVRASYLQAVNGIGGDFQRGQALQALITARNLTPEEIALVLDGAVGIKGDFQRAQVLTQLIQSDKLDAGQRTRVARAVAGIGDFQKSQVLMALAARGKMSPEEQDAYRDMLGEMQSDFSKQQVLQAVLQHGAPGSGDVNLALDAARGIGSDFQRGQVLTQLLRDEQLTEGDLLRVVEVSDGMGDFQRGQVLRAVLDHPAADSAVEKAVMKASTGMGDFERGRVRAGIRGQI